MAKISFLGDIALVGRYPDHAAGNRNPFADLEPTLSSSDFVAGNLECLAAGDEGENDLKRPRLKTTVAALDLLKPLHIEMVTLAHNHVYDNLHDGFVKTTGFLRRNHIDFLGAGESPQQAETPIIKEISGLRFGFFNYVSDDTNPNLPGNARVCLNRFDEEKIIADIKKIKKEVDFIILLLHWGGKMEGAAYPDFEQIHMGRRLIDGGADLIVSHHSHTLQPYEVYKGKYIFYSLGNFCCDDYIFEGKLRKLDRRRRTRSIILEVDFSKTGYTVNPVPLRNDETIIKIDPAVSRVLRRRNALFAVMKKNRWLWWCYRFYFKRLFPVFRFIFGGGRPLSEKIRAVKFKKIKKFFSHK